MGEAKAKEELCKMIDATMGILPSYEWGPEGIPEGQPIICELRADEIKPNKRNFDFSKFRGIAKGVWGVDAQKYIEEIRDEDR